MVPAQSCQRTNSLGLETPQGWTSRNINHTLLKDLWNRAKLKSQHAMGRRASLFHLKVQAGTVSASCLLASSVASHARFTWSVLLLQFLLVKAQFCHPHDQVRHLPGGERRHANGLQCLCPFSAKPGKGLTQTGINS